MIFDAFPISEIYLSIYVIAIFVTVSSKKIVMEKILFENLPNFGHVLLKRKFKSYSNGIGGMK